MADEANISVTRDGVMGPMIDIGNPITVQIQISADEKVVWVNVDGICRLRCSRIGEVKLEVGRPDD